MDSIEKIIERNYPLFNSLTDEEKEIVYDIATQIPMSCESVATIFILNGRKKQNLITHIYLHYGFVVE